MALSADPFGDALVQKIETHKYKRKRLANDFEELLEAARKSAHATRDPVLAAVVAKMLSRTTG